VGLRCSVGSVLQEPLKEMGFESRVKSVCCQARMRRGEGEKKEEKEEKEEGRKGRRRRRRRRRGSRKANLETTEP
jgi:hypothetical protein